MRNRPKLANEQRWAGFTLNELLTLNLALEKQVESKRERLKLPFSDPEDKTQQERLLGIAQTLMDETMRVLQGK